MEYFNRKIYTEKIEPYIGKNLIKVIVVTADEYKTISIDGIETWNIRKFLIDF